MRFCPEGVEAVGGYQGCECDGAVRSMLTERPHSPASRLPQMRSATNPPKRRNPCRSSPRLRGPRMRWVSEIDVDCTTAFDSKPAPTGLDDCLKSRERRSPFRRRPRLRGYGPRFGRCDGSVRSMLTERSYSRASSLPQVLMAASNPENAEVPLGDVRGYEGMGRTSDDAVGQ
jgi:hypothetical protein